jgi:hypothetical protein
LANLGYQVCDQTVGNVLRRHGLPPAPERKRTTTGSAFIRTHLALLAGIGRAEEAQDAPGVTSVTAETSKKRKNRDQILRSRGYLLVLAQTLCR